MSSCVRLILITLVSVAAARPQIPESRTENTQVEIERQHVRAVTPIFFPTEDRPPAYPQSAQRKVQENTEEILEKIAEVNKKHGLTPKKFKPNYFHFPLSYSRSKTEPDQFKFSRDPFSNPILDYVEKRDSPPRFRTPYLDKGGSFIDTNPEILPEDHVPGQQIKRKITHYQSFVMPSPFMTNQFNPGASMNPFGGHNVPRPSSEKEAIDNIKEVLSGTLQPPSAMPNMEQQMQQYYSYMQQQNYLQQMFGGQYPAAASPTGNEPSGGVSSQGQGANAQQAYLQYLLSMKNPQQVKARQNWNWPGANWFPIYIRDPFLQMYYAVTNMIEYGPNSGNEGPCKLTPRPQGSRVKPGLKTADQAPSQSKEQVTVEVNKRQGEDEIQIVKLEDSEDIIDGLDVEDIDLGDDDLVKLTINLPQTSRELKDNIKAEKMRWDEYLELRNDSKLAHLVSGKLDSLEPKQASSTSPIIQNPQLQVEELEDESEKAEDISIANQGSRKVFSKDNTGNGIFIHKLKVRKGGVAIAGPGGIATAGSGGTAIVGPNGIAYTHPNGLAIAGSGTKVVAVDPKIDLNEVIKESVLNGTHQVNSRVGKVVAVGPVIYFNRGEEV